jgi:hypothetical protein
MYYIPDAQTILLIPTAYRLESIHLFGFLSVDIGNLLSAAELAELLDAE